MSSRAGRPDLPARELARQLGALPAPLYEFAVFDGSTVRRVWRRSQALRSVGWLKHRNGRGGHVHVRPATAACVLVRGLTADGLAAIAADGLAPAAVVESAPGVFEAWFRLGREPDPRLAACVPGLLTARYGADGGAGRLPGFGRAAGFVNRTASLAGADGRYPRALLQEARGRVTPQAEELVAAAEERLARREAERVANGGDGSARDAAGFLAREVARVAKRHGGDTDRGRAFAAAARRMARAGFGRDEVAAALAACPELRARKGDAAREHAERTAAWAFGAVRRRPR